ncbi:MAG: fibronectin type III domain-containing protein, partial [Candidatus Magasanikbacteria bacterium]|nr:fibronectin type III domain-containing protein [Candidatus Magasanikbacteria bacterium]
MMDDQEDTTTYQRADLVETCFEKKRALKFWDFLLTDLRYDHRGGSSWQPIVIGACLGIILVILGFLTHYFRANSLEASGDGIPRASTPTFSSQATDGSGYVTFTLGTSDSDTVTTSHKFEYSLDEGNTWYDMQIQSVSSNQGNTALDNNVTRQIDVGASTNTVPYDPTVLMHMEDTDTSITDNMGNYGGTYTGALLSESGQFGNSIGFDGTDDTIDLGDITQLNSASSFTIMGWFKQSTVGEERGLFSKDGGTNKYIFGRTVTVSGIKRLYSYISNGSIHRGYFTYSGDVSNDTWFHYALVYDGSLTGDANREKVYINGAQKTLTFTDGTGIPATTYDLSTNNFVIGGSVSSINAEWSGNIDDFAIFTQPLSASEISSIYASELTLTTTTLTVVWDSKSASNGGGVFSGITTTAQIRVTPYDGSDGTTVTSANMSIDDQAPTDLGSFTLVSTSTAGVTKVSWSPVTETNFDRYDIWWGASSSDVENRTGSATQWTTSSDSNLASAGTTSTTLTNLLGGLLYYSIFAIDDYGNVATTTQISATIERDFISTETGDWNLGTTWGGSCSSSCTAGVDFPTSTDDVIVTSTHTVTIPTGTTGSFSTLTIRGTANLTLVGDIGIGTTTTIETGATLEQKNTTTQTISGTLTIDSGGTFTHTANTTAQSYEIDFSAASISIAGTVSASGKGLQGGQSSGANGNGTGLGTGNGTGAGGGAGYGGAGGTSSNSTAGGVKYGTTSTPANIGSGGGAGGAAGATGGAGGGLIQLTAATISVTGSIVANGNAGVVSTLYAGGGGSGGGIYLNPSTSISGNGSITANGGDGGDGSSHDGGGGGGGRIAIGTLEGTLDFTGTFSRSGGLGPGTANDGENGSLYILPNAVFSLSSSYSNLDWPGTISGTATDHDDTLSQIDVSIQRSNDSKYWNGSIWTDGEQWVTTVGTSSWSYTISATNFTDSTTNTVRSRATDSDGEVEATYTSDAFAYTTQVNSVPTLSAPTAYQISTAAGTVLASTTVADGDLHDTTTTIEYSLDNGSTWASSTLGDVTISGQESGFSTSTGQISGIDTSAGDKLITFQWLAGTDAPDQDISIAKLRVVANDTFDNGSYATSSAFALDTRDPASLANLTVVVATSKSVHLSWTAASDTNFDHYEIWYGTTQSDVQNRTGTATEWDNSDDSNLAVAVTTSSTITSGIAPGTYYFKIWASDDFLNDVTLSDISYTVVNTLPTVVTSTPSQSTSGTRLVTISAVLQDTDAVATSLIVEHSTNGTSWTSSTLSSVTASTGSVTTSTGNISSIDTDVASDNQVTLTIVWNAATDLASTSDDTVYIRLTPVDDLANGSSATTAAFVVDTVDPTAPGNLTAGGAATTTLTLTFGAASTEDHFTEYKIFYKQAGSGVTTGDTAFTSSSDSDLSSRTFNGTSNTTITGLSPNRVYAFNIWAYDQYGASSYATEMATYTPAAIPSNFTATENGENQIDLAWDANNNAAGTVYYIAYSNDTF